MCTLKDCVKFSCKVEFLIKEKLCFFFLWREKSSSSYLCVSFLYVSFTLTLLPHSQRTLHFWHFESTNMWAFSPQAIVCDTSWVSYNSTQFRHFLETGSSPTDPTSLPPSPQYISDVSCKSRLSPTCASDQLAIDWDFQKHPFFGSYKRIHSQFI